MRTDKNEIILKFRAKKAGAILVKVSKNNGEKLYDLKKEFDKKEVVEINLGQQLCDEEMIVLLSSADFPTIEGIEKTIPRYPCEEELIRGIINNTQSNKKRHRNIGEQLKPYNLFAKWVGKRPVADKFGKYMRWDGSPEIGYINLVFPQFEMIIINSILEKLTGEEIKKQWEWLEERLIEADKAKRPVIVAMHYSPYHSTHPAESFAKIEAILRSKMVPLLEKYKVKLALTGHTHLYERLYKNGVHYIGAGQVFQDLISCQHMPVFKLTKVFRQASKSSIIRFAHQINIGNVPKIPSPIARPSIWSSEEDCLFIDSEEATLEQLGFLKKAKALIKNTIENDRTHKLCVEDKTIGLIEKGSFSLEINISREKPIDRLTELENNDEDFPEFSIPKKFRHLNFNNLSHAKTHIEEFKEILKKIHPHSTINYGLSAVGTVCRLFQKTLPEKFGKNTEVQILTPQIRGPLGTHNLNFSIQSLINPFSKGKGQILFGDRIFRPGDRVIQTVNNYDLGVFNGDIGKILSVDSEEQKCYVEFGTGKNLKNVEIERSDLGQLSLAYAITIHKSQGSEFPIVILPITMGHFNMLYTGLTRAKKMIVLVGSRRALTMAIKNEDKRTRQTALAHLLNKDF